MPPALRTDARLSVWCPPSFCNELFGCYQNASYCEHWSVVQNREVTMSRLFIELTSQQHKEIKALVPAEGESINDYVLERMLSPHARPLWLELPRI